MIAGGYRAEPGVRPDPPRCGSGVRASPRAAQAAARAWAVLKPSDRVAVRICGNRLVRVRFVGWDRDWFVGARGQLYVPGCIETVNGHAVDFTREARA